MLKFITFGRKGSILGRKWNQLKICCPKSEETVHLKNRNTFCLSGIEGSMFYEWVDIMNELVCNECLDYFPSTYLRRKGKLLFIIVYWVDWKRKWIERYASKLNKEQKHFVCLWLHFWSKNLVKAECCIWKRKQRWL